VGLDIWVQQVAGGPPIRLTSDEAAEYSPTFSPDGSRVLYRSEREGGGLYSIPTLGGNATLLAGGGLRPRFSPDGSLVAYYTGPQGSYSGTGLYVVPAAGGEPRRLKREFLSASSPIWTPDGKHLLFVGTQSPGNWDWWVVSSDGGSLWSTGAREVFERQGLSAGPPGPEAWVEGNRVAFTAAQGDGTNIWRVAIEPGTWKINTPAERITFGTGELHAQAGANGRLVFTSGSNNIDIWSLPLDSDTATAPLQRLTSSASGDYSCDISSDGRMLAFRSDRSNNIDVWSRNLQTGIERAITVSPDSESLPKITADGSVVGYGVRRIFPPARTPTWAINAVPSGGGLPKELCRDCGPAMSWSSDGTKMLYLKPMAGGKTSLHLVDTVTGNDRKVAEHPEMETINAARFSPDDQWIVCKGDLNLRHSVLLVIPLQDWTAAPVNDWIPVTEGRSWDDVPRWSVDGKVVYFVSDRDGFRCIWARRLDPSSKRPLGVPFAVRHFHEWRLAPVSNLSQIELSVARDKLVLPLQEQTGSIWMLEPGTAATSAQVPGSR
jgi:Tol biopolymer transport system component